MLAFQLNEITLTGRNLVEASAGTGKTYAIASLYVRLLIEQDLCPEKILVVTFTEAATKELRGRIRERIRDAIAVLQGAETEDDFLKGLQRNASGKMPDRKTTLDRLDRALVSFDMASIFTIHGFCFRALQEHAFESGALFDTELSKDQTGLLQETVEDFWRSRFFTGSGGIMPLVLGNGWTPTRLTKLLSGKITNPGLQIIPRLEESGIAAHDENTGKIFCELKSLWEERSAEILDILRTHKGLRRSQDTYRADVMEVLIGNLEEYLAGDVPYAVFDGHKKLTTSFMEGNKFAKGEQPPRDDFFDKFDILVKLLGKRLPLFIGELADYVRERLPGRKAAANVRCFDDLLNDLHAALENDRQQPGSLADKLRSRYRAALIDEFQDTDPVQYRIFSAIFNDKETPLFLIGDPKQAIYSFRGADIFAYLEAKEDIEENRAYTMNRNWRSTEAMLDAFNAIFKYRGAPPFLYESIEYHPVYAGKIHAVTPLVLPDGFDASPLQIWFMPRGDERVISLGRGRQEVAGLVAAEISRLLVEGQNGAAMVDGRRALPEDIAVLVRSHKEGLMVQHELRRLGIPSVTQATGSVFETAEARDVFTLMAALAEPSDEGKVRAALISDFFGLSGDDLFSFQQDPVSWEVWLQKFRDYHDLWCEEGLLVASRALLDGEQGRGRVLSSPDGERRLTNILHCFELLHNISMAEGHAMEGLITWFGAKLADPPADEEFQIRLESDEKAVKIVTIHISKGLEYPIVFCPYIFGGIIEGDAAFFHDEEARQIMDVGSDRLNVNKQKARREQLAENLRLVYVALTRAKYRCYLVWGRFRHSETSAPAYLFHYPQGADKSGDIEAILQTAIENLDDQQMVEGLESLFGDCPAIAVINPPPSDPALSYAGSGVGQSALKPRLFEGEIDRSWRVASFSGIAGSSSHDHEKTDRDEVVLSDEDVSPVGGEREKYDIFSLQRGAETGIILHKIFEELDFGADAEKRSAMVSKTLAGSLLDERWYPAVHSMVNNVVNAPLPMVSEGFTLSQLSRGEWRAELDFFFPLKFINSETLKKVLSGAEGSGLDLQRMADRIGFRPVSGMMRGFIDMLFRWQGRYYILDWKSNHLGNNTTDYSAPKMANEMERNLYPLQYLLYATAVNRYLSLRVPGYCYEKQFGGVLYLFMRGINADSKAGHGVFFDLPPASLIETLTETLIAQGG